MPLNQALGMRIKLLIAPAIFSAPSCAFAVCNELSSHAEQRQCLEQEAVTLSRKIETAQDILRDRIAAWDEEPSYRSEARALLATAASQFRSFTAAQCAFEASAAAGGNGAGDVMLACQITLGTAYLKPLQEQAAWFPPSHV